MEQHRNSQSSLLSAIMGGGPSPEPANRPKNLAAVRAESSVRKGPQVPRGASYGRAVRRQRKAGREKRTGKIQQETAKLRLQRERLLDTAAAFARIWFDGPPAEQKKVGVSAYDRVAQRVEKQAQNLIDTGKASDHDDAIEQIETSMRETIRQHEVLLAEKAMAPFRAAKRAQMDLLQARTDARAGHPVVD